jgi:hypothetical protein
MKVTSTTVASPRVVVVSGSPVDCSSGSRVSVIMGVVLNTISLSLTDSATEHASLVARSIPLAKWIRWNAPGAAWITGHSSIDRITVFAPAIPLAVRTRRNAPNATRSTNQGSSDRIMACVRVMGAVLRAGPLVIDVGIVASRVVARATPLGLGVVLVVMMLTMTAGIAAASSRAISRAAPRAKSIRSISVVTASSPMGVLAPSGGWLP